MVDSLWPADAVAGAPSYSGRMLRQLESPMYSGATVARPLGARSGVRPGTSPTTVTATSTTWTCGPFAGVADVEAAAEAGPYSFSFDAVATGSVTAADATNPRKDIIYVQISDPAEGDGTTNPGVIRGYLAGSPAATPLVPPTPARSFVIAQITVPKVGAGSPSVTWVAPYVVAAGGVLPVDTKANLDAITGYTGQEAYVYNDTTANNVGKYIWTGSSWIRMWHAGSTAFAEATGTGINATGFNTTVTFPAGRFTVAPIVMVTNTGNSTWATNAQNITATNCQIAGYNPATGTAVASTWSWHAIQMTPTTAAG